MIHLSPEKAVANEDGFIMIATTVILLILVMLGISATNTTNIEQQIASNDKSIKEDFYNQEFCLATAKFSFRTWLTTSYLTQNETTAFFPQTGNDLDGNAINDEIDAECRNTDGDLVGNFKIRNIEPTGNSPIIGSTPTTGWADIAPTDAPTNPANNFPALDHKDKPDPGTGYDQKNFEIRRFVITSYSPDVTKNSVIQEGSYKVFNKY